MAVLPNTAVFADLLSSNVPAEIIHDEEIQQPVVIEIGPHAAHRPQGAILVVGLGQARLGGDVRERPIAVVVIEGVMVDTADEDILVTVVVVVTDRDAIIKARSGQPGLVRDVGEVAFAVAGKETVAVLRRTLFKSSNIGAVGEEDIQVPSLLSVEDRHAAGHRFRHVPLGRLAAIEREANLPKGEGDPGTAGLRKNRGDGSGGNQIAAHYSMLT